MIVPPRRFVSFLDGRSGNPTPVAFLPGALGAYLGTVETTVKLERMYGWKLLRHGIDYNLFGEIQNTIDNGMCMLEAPYKLSFLYVQDKTKPVIYSLIIKTDRARRELWLVTFHRIKREQFHKRLKPRQIIREHVEDEFMG